MTKHCLRVIVAIDERGPQARKGEAMMQRYTYYFNQVYDFQDTNMPIAEEAEWVISACLMKDRSSGYLGPGAKRHILD